MGAYALLSGWVQHSAAAEPSLVKPAGPLESALMPSSQTLREDIAGSTSVPEPRGDLTLRETLALTLLYNPQLRAFEWEKRAREAAVLQAGLRPNPELIALADPVGNNALTGLDGPTVTMSLSQLIELGGKRAARIKAAQSTQETARWDYEIKRLEVLTVAAQAFVEVLSAQYRLTLASDMQRLTEQVVAAVSARVRAGKVSPVEETKARVALSSVRIEQIRAEGELEAARSRLVASWGGTMPRFTKAVGYIETIAPLPTLDGLMRRLWQNPELRRWASALMERQALIHLEETRAIPNLTANLGIRHYNDTGDNALVAGVIVPLPVFNRNQGAILEAERRLSKAREEQSATESRVTAALNTAYRNLAIAYAEVTSVKTEVLPGAQSAFEAARKGYQLGKFNFIDFLDAQRTLFAARAQYVRALANYHGARFEVERLIGERIEGVNPHPYPSPDRVREGVRSEE